MDTNKEGPVTQAEIYTYRKADFSDADGNGDGAIDKEEMDKMVNHHADASESYQSNRHHHAMP